MKRGFASGELQPDSIFNMDETHIVLDMRSLRYLEFRGEDVKLMEIVQDKT